MWRAVPGSAVPVNLVTEPNAATTRAWRLGFGLSGGAFDTSFQSRIAAQKWIEPYTDHLVVDLRARGVTRLAVLTPSFTADCLETLEEIGIRLREQWLHLGGEELALVPCVNTHPVWIGAVADMVRDARGGGIQGGVG